MDSKIDIETWASLDYLGCPNYIVSTHARVYNVKHQRMITLSLGKGYLHVGIYDTTRTFRRFPIHRLVAMSFIPNPGDETYTVDHIDQNKLNNHVSNLRWASKAEQAANRVTIREKRRILMQFDLAGTFIREWDSAKTAAETIGCPEKSIWRCCTGEIKVTGGSQWRYKDLLPIPGEEFRPLSLPDFVPIHVSSVGRIIPSSNIPTYGHSTGGYLAYNMKRISNGKYVTMLVHKLVALAFIGEDNGLMVNHKDGNKTNNRVENLEYVTRSENALHAYRTGLLDQSKRYRAIIKICRITNTILAYYDSMCQAARENGVDVGNIRHVCTGKINHTGGSKYAYADDPAWKDAVAAFRAPPKVVLRIIPT